MNANKGAIGNVDSSADPGRPDADVTPDLVKQLIDRISLRGIRLVRWVGDTSPGRSGEVAEIKSSFEPPRMRIAEDELSLWFEHTVRCHDEDGDEVATLETGVLLDFDVSGDETPDLAIVSCFADTNGAFIAWPYIREAVQAMSTRLGITPITLGILRREDNAYLPD